MQNIEKYLKRSSIKEGLETQPMSDQDVELITKVINNSPTSTNSQQFSAIIIRDQEMKDFISIKNWNQGHVKNNNAFILFIGDRTRTNIIKKEAKVNESELMKKNEFLRITVDATIAATYAMSALMDMNYACTMIGGVVGFANELEKKLNIPSDSMIVLGLVVGKTKTPGVVKPKMNKVFLEKYDVEQAKKDINEYEENTKDWFIKYTKSSWKDSVIRIADKNERFAKPFEVAGKYIQDKYESME